jgi:hypothetical protein
MALISNPPNFYSQASPSYADFNLVHRLIAQVVGGRAPGAVNEYDIFNGGLSLDNLDTTHSAGFRLSQRAEQRSVFTMEASDEADAAGLICGPVPYDCEVVAAGIVNDGDAAKITGGTVTFYVNGVTIVSIAAPPCSSLNQMTGVAVRLQLRAGDLLHLTHALTFDAGANHPVRVTLFCTALHTS